jgi:hypothetical protein
MLSASSRAANAVTEAHGEESQGQDAGAGQGQFIPKAHQPGPARKLLGRLGLLLVALGARLVRFGLPSSNSTAGQEPSSTGFHPGESA